MVDHLTGEDALLSYLCDDKYKALGEVLMLRNTDPGNHTMSLPVVTLMLDMLECDAMEDSIGMT